MGQTSLRLRLLRPLGDVFANQRVLGELRVFLVDADHEIIQVRGVPVPAQLADLPEELLELPVRSTQTLGGCMSCGSEREEFGGPLGWTRVALDVRDHLVKRRWSRGPLVADESSDAQGRGGIVHGLVE